MISLTAIERAGRVRRWHTNADLCHTDDPTAYHAGRVARIIVALWPDCSLALLKAALTHDDGEQGAWGDVSGPAKDAMPPEVRAAMDEAEYQARYAIWGRDFLRSETERNFLLRETERKRLKFADRLDAFMWANRHAPHILGGDGWPEAREWLLANAIALGVADVVAGVVE